MTWQLAVIGIAAVLAITGIVVYFATDAKHEGEEGAVDKDDKVEAQAVVAEQQRVARQLAQPAPTGVGILAAWKARRERAKGKP